MRQAFPRSNYISLLQTSGEVKTVMGGIDSRTGTGVSIISYVVLAPLRYVGLFTSNGG